MAQLEKKSDTAFQEEEQEQISAESSKDLSEENAEPNAFDITEKFKHRQNQSQMQPRNQRQQEQETPKKRKLVGVMDKRSRQNGLYISWRYALV